MRKFLAWSGLVVAAAVVVVAAVYVVFWPLSDLIARHDVGTITGPHRAAALQAARDAVRGHLLIFGAGLFAAGALIYTARIFSVSRQGQVTGRYTQAIEQLGSDKPDVRIGGIYALERIARDSPRDHPTIMEVLAAFIRMHSHEQWPPAQPGEQRPERATRPDVQAAATVIGRRTIRYDIEPPDLTAADLTRADLTGANLTSANLTRANLISANLTGTNLTSAWLDDADLTSANLGHANLTSAWLDDANLTSANFGGANLTSAGLDRANLNAAWLDGANLAGAYFGRANLSGAHWPSDEAAPQGWERDAGSDCLKQAATAAGAAAE